MDRRVRETPSNARHLPTTAEERGADEGSFGGTILKTVVGKSERNEETEFDVFGKYVASQLKQLPLENAVLLQIKFQSMIGEERLYLLRQSKEAPT